jgi:hypothetical protein
MPSWPRPERLLPPRIVEAISVLQAGDLARAVTLTNERDAADPLAADVVRLVRARAALEDGDAARARRDLRTLARRAEPALAWFAVRALADDLVRRRQFAAALRLWKAARTRLGRDAALRLWAEVAIQALLLERKGALPERALADLESRLDRHHPPALHGAVHLLRAERSLLAGLPAEAVAAAREARPHVRSSGDAALAARLDAVGRLLRAPFVDVEDWEEPRRTVSREELAALEARPWVLWIDLLHHAARRRAARQAPRTLALEASSPAWVALDALLRNPRRSLGWAQLAAILELGESAASRAQAERRARDWRAEGLPVRVRPDGMELESERTIAVFPADRLPALEQRLLARLATTPGASAAELARGDGARRTVLEHLARLRRAGYVRMVGGGREARYHLV